MQDLINSRTQLQFGGVKLLNANLVEVFINAGVEVDLQMVLECEKMLTELMGGAYGILLNEKHVHSFTPEAKAHCRQMNGLKAIAVVMKTKFTDIANKYLESFSEDSGDNERVFYDRDKALEWLESQVF